MNRPARFKPSGAELERTLALAGARLRAAGAPGAVSVVLHRGPDYRERASARLDWPLFDDAPHLLVYPTTDMDSPWVLRSSSRNLAEVASFQTAASGAARTAANATPALLAAPPPAAAPLSVSTLPPPPRYVGELIGRGATMLRAQGLPRLAHFVWWADGNECPYLARLVWAEDEPAPRLVVLDGRSGEFVGRSLPGRPFEIDPTVVGIFSLPDEEARRAWRPTPHDPTTRA